MNYYSCMKRNEIMFAGKCMEPEIIMLSEISQTGKDTCFVKCGM
jgi:hypothetical protein